ETIIPEPGFYLTEAPIVIKFSYTPKITTVSYAEPCVTWTPRSRTDTILGGGQWARRASDYGSSFNSTAPFQVQPRPWSGLQSRCDNTLLQSPHPGGMMVAVADGSVHFVSGSISPVSWSYAVRPDDGQAFAWPD